MKKNDLSTIPFALFRHCLWTFLIVIIIGVTPFELQAQTANAGPDDDICTSTYQLQGNQPDPGNSGLWILLSGAGDITTPTLYNTEVTNLGTAEPNVFRWTIDDGSGSPTSDEVTINNNSFTVFAGFDETICTNSYTLNGTDPETGTGIWTKVGGATGTFTNAALYNTEVTGIGHGPNEYNWEVSRDGCTFDDNVVVTNHTPTQPNAGSDETICQTSYQLQGNVPAIGTGLWTVASGSGTFSNASLHNPTVSGLGYETNTMKYTISYEECSLEDLVIITSYYFEPQVGQPQTYCSTTATLSAEDPSPGTGYWTVLDGGTAIVANSTNPMSAVSNLQQGVNSFLWTATINGCTNTATMEITNDLPSEPDAGQDQTVCENTATLTAVAPVVGTGTWALSSGNGTVVSPSQLSTNVTGLGYGPNIFRWRIRHNECTLDDFVTITNHEASPSAGNDKDICETSTQLAANDPAPYTGIWTKIDGSGIIQTPSLYNTLVTNLGTEPNTFRWTTTEQSNCSASDDVVITNSLVVAEAGEDQTICTSTILEGNPPAPGNGIWKVIGGQGTLTNPTLYNTTVTLFTQGTHKLRWQIENNGCISNDTVKIINDHIEAEAGPDRDVCGNSYLEAEDPAPGIGLWTSSSGATIADPTLHNTLVSNLDYGENVFHWAISHNNCFSDDEVIIMNYQFDISAGEDQTVCDGEATLNGDPPGTGGLGAWTLQSGAGTFTDYTFYNTSVYNLGTGSNTFIWAVVRNGCSDFDMVEIQNNQFTPYAGDDQTTCSSITVLDGDDPAPGTGLWTVEAGTATIITPTLYNSEVIQLSPSPDQNIFRWTMTKNDCTFADELEVTYNQPSDADAGEDQSVCQSYTTLTAGVPQLGSGVWTKIAGNATIHDPSNVETLVTDLSEGENRFVWTVTYNNCISRDTVMVSNDLFEAYAGADQELCQASTVLQGANPYPGTGTWELVDGSGTIVYPDYYLSPVTNLGSGINTFRWNMIIGACNDEDEVNIINNSPTPAEAGTSTDVCGDFTTLNGNTPVVGTGLWTLETGTAVIANPTLPNTEVTELAFGSNIFRWTITNLDCVSSDIVSISNDLILSDAGDAQDVCDNQTQLAANPPAPGSGMWSVVAGNGIFASSNNPNTMVTELDQGVNTFKWTVIHNACTDISNVSITNNKPSAAYAGNDQEISGTEATLYATPPSVGTGAWSLVSGDAIIENTLMPETDVSELEYGENVFRWTVTNFDCISEDDVAITRIEGVWPGDADYNTVVDQYDIFPIGINFGLQGAPRDSVSILWIEHYSPDWAGIQPSGANNKFIDCNGNGIVGTTDVEAIVQNFGETHEGGPRTAPNDADYTLMFKWREKMEDENIYRASMMLDRTGDINQIYALGYEIEIENAQNILFDEITFDYDSSWLTVNNSNFVHVEKVAESENKLFLSISRTDQQNRSGEGILTDIYFPLAEGTDTTGLQMNVTTQGGILSDWNEVGIEIIIDTSGGSIGIADNTIQTLQLYPNPASESIYFMLPENAGKCKISIFDMLGNAVKTMETTASGQFGVDIKDYAAGMYILRVENDHKIYQQQFQLIKK